MKKVALLSMVLLGFSAGIVHAETKNTMVKALSLDHALNKETADTDSLSILPAAKPTNDQFSQTAFDGKLPDRLSPGLRGNSIQNADELAPSIKTFYLHTENIRLRKELEEKDRQIEKRDRYIEKRDRYIDEHLIKDEIRQIKEHLDAEFDRIKQKEVEEYKREHCRKDSFCRGTPPHERDFESITF